MIEFIRDNETGLLNAYKDGIKVGTIITMGDEVKNVPQTEEKEKWRVKENGHLNLPPTLTK